MLRWASMSTTDEGRERKSQRRLTLSFLVCMVGPLVVGVILNALVRPGIATALGGERHSHSSGVRSQDTWWSFDADTVRQHPVLTGFLEASDGLIAVWTLAVTAVILLLRWLIVVRMTRSRRA